MNLQKWDPIREFERLHDEMERVYRGWPTQARTGSSLGETTCAVAVDILENVEEVVLRAELPGVKPADVSVKVEDDILSISGEKKFEHDEKKDTYLRVERAYGSFTRSFTLPLYVDAGKIMAEYKDGVLTLRLPKKPETKPRQIQVKVG